MMSLNDFLNKLDLYGADLSRWPEDDIKPALTCMARDKIAKTAFAETEAMEALLRFHDTGLGTHFDSTALADNVMRAINAAGSEPEDISFSLMIRNYIAPAVSGLMAMAIVGFMIGLPAVAGQAPSDPFQQAVSQAVGDDDADLYTEGLFSS